LQLSFTVEKMGIQKHKRTKYEYIMIILQHLDQLTNTSAMEMEVPDTDPVVDDVATTRVLYLCELIVNVNVSKMQKKLSDQRAVNYLREHT